MAHSYSFSYSFGGLTFSVRRPLAPPCARASSTGSAALGRLEIHAGPSTRSRAAAAPCLRLQSRRRGRPPALQHGVAYLKAAPPRHRAQSQVQKARLHTQPQSTGASPARHYTGQGPATSRKQDSEHSSAQQKGAARHFRQVRRPPCLPLRSREGYCGGALSRGPP